MYKVESISHDRWIFISSENSLHDPDEFIALIKEYQLQIGGEIVAVSEDTQYALTNDPLQLVFQWDSLFGITVVVPDETDIVFAEKTMHLLCDHLNKKKS
ncbi:MAG: hypothetical protein LBU77_01785 [Clostridiales bacterium]|jgi:hypothetical protein|nr:hypothetical protein [Clostridiales bacterium]